MKEPLVPNPTTPAAEPKQKARRCKTKLKASGKFFELSAEGSPEFIASILKALPMLDGDGEDEGSASSPGAGKGQGPDSLLIGTRALPREDGK